MKRSSMPRREKPLERRTPLAKTNGQGKRAKSSPAERRRLADKAAADFRRKYHSPERVFFVQVVLGCRIKPGTRAENAHIERDGMGRKADYTKIVGLSKPYHTGALGLDTIGRAQFEKLHGVDVGILAARTEQLWQERGPEVIAQAKADGTYDRWLNEGGDG